MIRRFFPIQDTTITNAYDDFFTARKEEANLGGSDVLETFVLYNRDENEEYELSRILLKFDITDIQSKITAQEISGSKFYLKLFNVAHAETLPDNFTLYFYKLTRHWVEGIGLDFEGLEDTGGASWLTFDTTPDGDPRPTTNDWLVPGGDYDDTDVKSVSFVVGDEDVSIDITDWVQEWMDSVTPVEHYGILIKFSDAQESSNKLSKYTKQFFARLSQYFYKRPNLEMLYEESESTNNDYNRNHFVKDSVLYSSPINYLYYHNKPRGFLEDIPGYASGEDDLTVVLYDEDGGVVGSPLSSSWVSTGVYRASASLPSDYVFDTAIDKWFRNEDLVNPIFVGSIVLECPHDGNAEVIETKKSKISIRELKPSYSTDEVCRFKVDAIELNWNPNIYVSYFNDGRNTKLKLNNTYYKIVRKIDNTTIVEYSCLEDIGVDYSKLYYNEEFNYFTMYFDYLEPGYMYEIRFMTVFDWGKYEHPETFKFRIDNPLKFRF